MALVPQAPCPEQRVLSHPWTAFIISPEKLRGLVVCAVCPPPLSSIPQSGFSWDTVNSQPAKVIP